MDKYNISFLPFDKITKNLKAIYMPELISNGKLRQYLAQKI